MRARCQTAVRENQDMPSVERPDAPPPLTSTDSVDDPLRELARLLAAGCLRLLARRDDHRHVDVDGHDPSISLDSLGQQSVNWTGGRARGGRGAS